MARTGYRRFFRADDLAVIPFLVGSALVVVLLVSAAERADAIVPALEQASRRDVSVVVQQSEEAALDGQVIGAAKAANARVVVDVSHPKSSQGRAVIHLHDADGSLIRETTADFPGSQPPKERARAIGFAIAAMIGAEDHAPPVAPSTTAAGTAGTEKELPRDAPQPVPKREEVGDDELRFGVELSGAGLTDTKGSAGSGASFALLWRPATDFELRLGGDARWLRAASELGGRAGIAWRFARWTHVALAAKAEVLFVRDAYDVTATRTNPNGKALPSTTTAESSVTPGVAFGPEVEGSPFRVVSLFLAPSLEIAPRQLAATQSTLWVTVNAGARFRF